MIGSQKHVTFGRKPSHPRPSASTFVRVPNRAMRTLERRKTPRDDRWCICYVHTHEFGQDVIHEAILLDVSDSGARIRCRHRSLFPDALRLRAPRLGLDISAQKVWQDGFDTGMAFA